MRCRGTYRKEHSLNFAFSAGGGSSGHAKNAEVMMKPAAIID